MDLTPVLPLGKKIIQSYSNEGFKINGEKYNSNIIVTPENVMNWSVTEFDKLQIEDFEPLKNTNNELLIIGCGLVHKQMNFDIRCLLSNFNIEVMNTGAACRTYNILLGESRLVSAALFLSK